jgi:hypothetical protein
MPTYGRGRNPRATIEGLEVSVDKSVMLVALCIQFTRPIKLLLSMFTIPQTLEEPEEEEVEEWERRGWSDMEEEDEEN